MLPWKSETETLGNLLEPGACTLLYHKRLEYSTGHNNNHPAALTESVWSMHLELKMAFPETVPPR